MRTLVIIMSVLAIMAVVYGFDADKLRKFNDDFVKCNEELGGSLTEPRIETIKCAMVKDGGMLNANGEYIKEAALQRIEEFISDASRLEQANTIYTMCYDEAVGSGATGNEQTEKIITCGMPILGLIDKLE